MQFHEFFKLSETWYAMKERKLAKIHDLQEGAFFDSYRSFKLSLSALAY